MKIPRRMKVPSHAFTLALAAAFVCSGCAKQETGKAYSSFASPGAAAQEFAEAVRTGDKGRLSSLLGPESAPLLNPGDTVQGGTERKAFVQAYDSVRLLVPAGPDAFFLEVGAGRWPLPLPIVKEGNEWKFDTRTGIRELVLRRIGRNELAVLGVMRGIVGAQHDYAAKMGAFASKLRSEPGKQDGLYWETTAGEPESPAGPLLAWAEAQGYTPGGAQPAPYRGYFYRRLKLADPKKEFAILAYPAEYGASGIMTFIVNQDGAIYRKNLGVDTGKAAQEIQGFAPDATWTRES
jgi:hypothetical protein